MSIGLGPTRPEKLTIWPVERARIKARLTQDLDGRGWDLRVGPVPGVEVARVIDQFVW